MSETVRCDLPEREAHSSRKSFGREKLLLTTGGYAPTVSSNKAVEKQGGHQTMHGYAGSPG
jgi:hypothetical protein